MRLLMDRDRRWVRYKLEEFRQQVSPTDIKHVIYQPMSSDTDVDHDHRQSWAFAVIFIISIMKEENFAFFIKLI